MDIFAEHFPPEVPKLQHLVDISLLEKIDIALTKTAEISFSIFDPAGVLLSQTVFESDPFHRLIVAGARFAPLVAERILPRLTEDAMDFMIHPCLDSMSLIVVPIRLDDLLLAYIVGGPVWMVEPLQEELEKLSVDLGIDREALLAGSRKCSVVSENRLHAACEFLLSIADITSQLCAERHRTNRNISLLTSLYNIETAMSSSLELKEVLQTVLDNALHLLEAETGSIMLLNDTREELRIFVAQGLSDDIVRSTRVRLGVGIAGAVAQEGKPRLMRKGVKEAPSLSAKSGSQMKSAISVPLKVKSDVIGVLNISGKLGRENFSEDEMKLLTILAVHAAVSIENAKLYESTQKRSRELAALFQVGKAITSTLNRKAVLQQALDSAVGLLKARAGSLMLVDGGTGELYIEVAHGLSQEIVESTRIPVGQGISGGVAREGEPRLLLKGKREADSKLSESAREIEPAICVPLQVEDRIIGVLNIRGNLRDENFSHEDMDLSLQFANQAAIAIENAKLHDNLKDLFVESITALANAIDARDPYTRGHSERVTEFSVEIAQAMGLKEHEVEFIRYAALLHDIGKININDEILKKPGKLTDEEFAIMKLHPTYGVQIMEPVTAFRQMLPFMFHHHEQFSSGGYPAGLAGEEIPAGARILTVADAFDAMTSDRPYRPAMSYADAVEELMRNSGKQFDPAVVDVFVEWIGARGLVEGKDGKISRPGTTE